MLSVGYTRYVPCLLPGIPRGACSQVSTQAAGAGGRGSNVLPAGGFPAAGRYVPRGGARAVRRGREILETQVRVDAWYDGGSTFWSNCP